MCVQCACWRKTRDRARRRFIAGISTCRPDAVKSLPMADVSATETDFCQSRSVKRRATDC